MKNLLTLFLILFISQLMAQNFTPIPTSNVVWNENISNTQSFCADQSIQITGDTLINGTVYHKLYVTGVEYFMTQPNGFCTNTVLRSFSYHGGYFRNDSLNKKVWYRTTTMNRDTLLYDFNLQVGDTLPETYLYDFSEGVYIIDSIDFIPYGGSTVKRYIVNNFCLFDPINLIEGVGSNAGFLNKITCRLGGTPNSLTCMNINNTSVYPDSSTNCLVITNITEVKKELDYLIYPNPSSGTVNIANAENIRTIRIYNLQGQLVKSLKPSSNQFELPEKTGMYIIQIEDTEGNVVSKRLFGNKNLN